MSHTAAPHAPLTVDLAALHPSEQRALLERLQALMPDQSYVDTPMGADIKAYLAFKDWKGMDARTLAARESQLGVFANDHANLTLQDMSGRAGARLIEAFLIRQWSTGKTGTPLAAGTRANRTITLRDFFKWAYRDGRVDHNPMEFVDTPSRRGKRRDAHDRSKVLALLAAQPRPRDRIAIDLMARQAFRKDELRLFRLGHVDYSRRTVSIFGKGSKFAVIDLFDDIAAQLDRYAQERALDNPDGWRDEHLLYRLRVWKAGGWPAYQLVERHERDRPLSRSGMQAWWEGCLGRARMARFPMHELRHTAGTDFHHGPARGDYELTRQFMRHENVQTTAGYIHTAPAALTRAVRDWERSQNVQ